VNILQPSRQAIADLIVKCSCGCVFEYEFKDVALSSAIGTVGYHSHPCGDVYVVCPSCRSQVRIGGYELSASVSSGQDLRRELALWKEES